MFSLKFMFCLFVMKWILCMLNISLLRNTSMWEFFPWPEHSFISPGYKALIHSAWRKEDIFLLHSLMTPLEVPGRLFVTEVLWDGNRDSKKKKTYMEFRKKMLIMSLSWSGKFIGEGEKHTMSKQPLDAHGRKMQVILRLNWDFWLGSEAQMCL